MASIVDCPQCQRKLRVPDDLLGLKVKCPSCATMFTASETPSEPPSAPAAQAPEPPPTWLAGDPSAAPSPTEPTPAPAASQSAAPRESDTRRCPACGESIPIEATRCRHCAEPVGRASKDEEEEEDERPWERPYRSTVRRDCEPHRGALVLVLGILSIVIGAAGAMLYGLPSLLIGLPMGIVAWTLGQKDLRRMRMNEMDPTGMGLTQAGWICGIVGTSLSGIFGLCCVVVLIFIGFSIAATPRPAPPGPGPTRPPTRKFSVPLDPAPVRVERPR